MSDTATPARFGCPVDERCTAGIGHEGDCVLFDLHSGLPDPHRHNPFAVGLALVVIGAIAYAAVALVVLAMIAGFTGTFR